MCNQCELKPVYEFTNKRKLCKNCFVNWFQKKFLYTIRKFEMMNHNDVVYFNNKGNNGNFREAALLELLRIYSDKSGVEIIPINSTTISPPPTHKNKLSINNRKKIAVSSTSDTESKEIIHTLAMRDISKLKSKPVELINGKIVIKPLYLFLDKEVLLYAKIKNLRFKKSGEKETNNKYTKFIDDLEKKHPEIKQSIVSSYLKLNGLNKN